MVEDAVRNYLVTSAPLMAILTKGIVTFQSTGRNGIGLSSTPALFTGGYLGKCGLVKERTLLAMGSLRDTHEQVTAARGFVEIYLYDDGDSGYSSIVQAQELIYELLTGKFISGAGYLRWTMDTPDLHDSTLDNAAVVRSDYMLTKVRGN